MTSWPVGTYLHVTSYGGRKTDAWVEITENRDTTYQRSRVIVDYSEDSRNWGKGENPLMSYTQDEWLAYSYDDLPAHVYAAMALQAMGIEGDE